MWFCSAEINSGVFPWYHAFDTSAPFSRRNAQTTRWPFPAAASSEEMPWLSI
jgi:hypothetical protein